MNLLNNFYCRIIVSLLYYIITSWYTKYTREFTNPTLKMRFIIFNYDFIESDTNLDIFNAMLPLHNKPNWVDFIWGEARTLMSLLLQLS